MIDTTDLRKTIASNVVRFRHQRGLSQEGLAQIIGVSPVHINRIENGHHSPKAELLYSLEDALEVTADQLRQIPLDSH